MTNKDANDTNSGQGKTVEVAPYMTTKKDHEKDAPGKTGIIIPAILFMVVAVVIIASFFTDEYNGLVAGFAEDPVDSSTGEANITSEDNENAVDKTAFGVNQKTAKQITTSTPAQGKGTASPAQTMAQSGQNTAYNLYSSPHPQVNAPQYRQTTPNHYPAPYGISPEQANWHNEMQQRRQQWMNERQHRRNVAIQRMEKNRQQRQQRMEQRRAEYLRSRNAMPAKAEEAQALHAI